MPYAILCSGGDSPGMNACIEFAFKKAREDGEDLLGIIGGFSGLARGEIISLEGKVEGIGRFGGTILRTSRSRDFATPNGKIAILHHIKDNKIKGVIVLGGDGSMRDGVPFLCELGIPTVGIPCTIDDDVPLTQSIGFDSACNKALQLLDSIKDTALALPERLFVLETLGGRTGHIAVAVAYSGGADFVCIPEIPFDEEMLVKKMEEKASKRGWAICVVAEGVGGYKIADTLEKKLGIRVRLTAIGHAQRGGSPSYKDRFLAKALSEEAVRALEQGESAIMIGWRDEKIVRVDIEELRRKTKEVSYHLYQAVNRCETSSNP